MDSFARDLFNFAAGLSRAQAKYDATTPKERDICGICDGTGKFGCTVECSEGGIEDYKFCRKHHRCPGKCDDGMMPMERDAQDAAAEARWECAREDRMGEDKE